MPKHTHKWNVIDTVGKYEIHECTICGKTRRVYVD